MATVIDELITLLSFDGDTKELDVAKQKLDNLKKGLDTFARNAALAGGAITGVAGLVGRTILGFDRQFNELSAVYLNESEETMGRLRAQALELGATTSKSASDAASAQTELARAGLSANQVLAATPEVLNLAIAGNLSMGESALLVASQLNAYNLEASETTRITDVLAATAANSATTVQQLGPAFRQVAPIAADLGVEMETVAASIGTLRTAGLRAEQAGTGLRNILAILLETPTADRLTAFQQLGVDYEQLKTLVQSGDLVTAFKLLDAAGLDAETSLRLFGREAATAATILSSAAGSGGLDDFTQGLQRANGTADQMRIRMESGLPGATAQFTSALEGAQLALGDSGFTGMLVRAVEGVTTLIRWMGNLPGPIHTVISGLFVLGPLLLGLAFAAKAASFAISGLIFYQKAAIIVAAFWEKHLIGLRIQLIAMAVWQKIVAAATWLWTAAQWVLNVALTANPIGLIIVGIAALIAIIIAVALVIWKFRDTIIGAFGQALEWAKKNWPLILAILTGPIGLVILAVWKFRDQIIDAIQFAIQWVKDNWPLILAVLTGPIGMAIYAIWHFRDQIIEVFKKLADVVPDWLKNGISTAFEVVGNTAGGIKHALGFAEGGEVPGPAGAPRAAIVHGGEMVLPQRVSQMVMNLAAGPQAFAPALPSPAPVMKSVTNTFSFGDIQLSIANASTSELQRAAVDFRRYLADQLEDLADDFDSPILR